MTSIGIAKTNLKSIVRAKLGKQLRFPDFVEGTAANSSRVVKYQYLGNPSNIVENILQSLTDTFGRFTTKYLVISIVAVRVSSLHIFGRNHNCQ